MVVHLLFVLRLTKLHFYSLLMTSIADIPIFQKIYFKYKRHYFVSFFFFSFFVIIIEEPILPKFCFQLKNKIKKLSQVSLICLLKFLKFY